MANVINCSYARGAIKHLTVDLQTKKDAEGKVISVEKRALTIEEQTTRRQRFAALFTFTEKEIEASPHLQLFTNIHTSATFDINSRRLLDTFNRKWNGGLNQRQQWLDQFSTDKWKKLSKKTKQQHHLSDCSACARDYPALHFAFPVKSNKQPKNSVWPQVQQLKEKVSQAKATADQKAAQITASKCLSDIQNVFQEKLHHDVRALWAADSSSGLQLTPTKAERREMRRKIEREITAKREEDYFHTDFSELYATSLSKSEYQRRRLDDCMESREVAESRMQERISGSRKRKHCCLSLNYSAMKWDWRRLVDEAKMWEDGKQVNWSAIARQNGVHECADTTKLANNGGQIVQAVLTDAGIDITKFFTAKGVQTGAPRARRAIRHSSCGISVPRHTPLQTLEAAAKEKYTSGQVIRAIDIVPRQYEQHVFTTDKTSLVVRVKTVHGQKVNLHSLIELFCKQKKDLLASSHFNPATMPKDEVIQRLEHLDQVRLLSLEFVY